MHLILGGWEGEVGWGGGGCLFEWKQGGGEGWGQALIRGWALIQILNMLPTL